MVWRLRPLLAILGVITLLPGAGVFPPGAAAQGFPLDAIGRLIVDQDRICTAFVVRSEPRRSSDRFFGVSSYYENWIASAGHCFGRDLAFVQGAVTHRITQVIGYSGGVAGHDVMIAAFTSDRALPTLEPAFGEYPQPGDPLMLIGYGRGALMARVGPLEGYDPRGHLLITNHASPGNSGGPVLIPGTRRVVGIGIETTVDRPTGTSPLLCVVAACPIKPPYTAAHIDRIKGVGRF